MNISDDCERPICCGRAMKRNGKDKSGTQRYLCPLCGFGTSAKGNGEIVSEWGGRAYTPNPYANDALWALSGKPSFAGLHPVIAELNAMVA